MEKAHYNLDSERYEKQEEENYDVPIKTLREFIEVLSGNRINSKEGETQGEYPLYYCSILGNLYLNSYTFDQEGLIINSTNGSGKCAIYYHNGRYSVGNSTIHFKSKDSNVLNKYIYLYFRNNMMVLEKEFKGLDKNQLQKKDLLILEFLFLLSKSKI